jgi:hypothetical protein
MKKIALETASAVFFVVSLLHLFRSLLKIPVTFGAIPIPMVVSWVGASASLALAIWMFIASRE